LSTRICLSKPIPQSTYSTLAIPKILGYFYLAGPPSSIPIGSVNKNYASAFTYNFEIKAMFWLNKNAAFAKCKKENLITV
jgi:hypothetical protein